MSHAINETQSGLKTIHSATILNCLFPGLGFLYLGKWKSGIINLVLAQGIVWGCLFLNEPTLTEHIHWVMMAVVVLSATWIRSTIFSESTSSNRNDRSE